MDWLYTQYLWLYRWVEDDTPNAIVLGVLILLLVTLYVYPWKHKRQPREREMSRRTHRRRKAYVRSCVSDAVCNGLEEALQHGYLNAQQVEYWSDRIARSCGLVDLKPRRRMTIPNPEDVKTAIRERLMTGFSRLNQATVWTVVELNEALVKLKKRRVEPTQYKSRLHELAARNRTS